MSKIYGRRNGVWSPASNKGSVRFGGAWNSFGLSGPAYESIVFPNTTPNLTDAVDASDVYTLGLKFRSTAARPCYGARWRVPDNAPNPNGNPHAVTLWTVVGESAVATKTFTPTPGVYQDILFDTPYNLAASPTDYVISVYTWHYVHRSPTPSSGWTVTSPSGNVVGNEGRLGTGGSNTYPSVAISAWYYITPLVGT